MNQLTMTQLRRMITDVEQDAAGKSLDYVLSADRPAHYADIDDFIAIMRGKALELPTPAEARVLCRITLYGLGAHRPAGGRMPRESYRELVRKGYLDTGRPTLAGKRFVDAFHSEYSF